jgi:hypothetical protein
VDRQRVAPIPWSVSLPCVAAVVALAFGWRALGHRSGAETTTHALEAEPTPTPAISPAVPAAVPPVAPDAVAPAPREAAVERNAWTPLAQFDAAGGDEGARRTAVATLVRLRDRAGSGAERLFLRIEPASRTYLVASAHVRAGGGDALARGLAAFGKRLDSLVLVPARVAERARPWIAVFLADEGAGATAADAPLLSGFDGVVAGGDAHATCVEVGVRQLRAVLVRGPDSVVLEWLLVGAVGAAASEPLADAVHVPDAALLPSGASVGAIPSLSQLMEWRTPAPERSPAESIRATRLATSFVAWCLERGPNDPRATGCFELLLIDGRSLPADAAARDAEIAARLGATRLDELDAAWRAARR